MDSVAKVTSDFVSLTITGYILSALSKVWNGQYVTIFQSKLVNVWRLMVHISKKCLKNIELETPSTTSYFEQEYHPTEVLSNKCPDVCQDTGSYVHIFMVLIVLCFMCVIAWYIWNYSNNGNKCSGVRCNQLHENEACGKLKEVYKILQRLNHQLAPAVPSKIPRLQSLHSLKEHKNQALPSKSQLSDISRRQSTERKLSNEELRQKLQAALQLLEEINIAINNTPSELISNLENDEAVLSAAHDIIDTNISTNLKEQKDTEANGKFAKNPKLLATHSENSASAFNYCPTDYEKENLSPKTVYSIGSFLSNSKRNMSNEDLQNDCWMTLHHQENAATNEKFTTDDTVNYRRDNVSGLKNEESENVLFESQSQSKKPNSKPTKSKSSLIQCIKNEHSQSLESADPVNEALKYHQENISGLTTDENEKRLHELEKQWNEMIRTPVKLDSGADESMADEKIKYSKNRDFAHITEVDNCKPQSSSYDMMRSEDTDLFKESFNQKDLLSSFDHQINYEGITSRRRVKESNASTSDLFFKYHENNESRSTFQDLNLNNLQTASTGSRKVDANDFSKETVKAPKRKDNLNVSGKKKALNISILFNRDIQLAKCVQ